MDIYASAALTGLGYAVQNQRDTLRRQEVRNAPPHPRERPSMQNVYQSTHWTDVRTDEQQRGASRWNAAQNPMSTGIVPKPAYASMFANPSEMGSPQNGAIQTMSGQVVSPEQFTHNNMQPFFRGKVTQNVDAFANHSILETYTGRSDLIQKKQEVEAMFAPTAGYANVCGMQNNDDYYLSHMEAPNARRNDFPIEQIRVGKGLGQGFTASPTGGFQQANTLDYIRPKTVDELRVASKPKLSFQLPVQAPAKGISQRGILGDVEKNRPDTYYEQTSNMWLKTTGANTKETSRPVVDLKPTARVDTHKEYQGAAKITQPGLGDNDDYGKSGVMVYNNERMTTQTRTVVSNLTSTVKAIISPILDVMKPSTKEYTIDAPRVYGSMQAQIPSKPTTYDPVSHVMRTTIKETTIHDTTIANLKGPEQGTVQNQDSAKKTVRETLETHDTVRNMAGHSYRVTVYNVKAVAKKTVRETLPKSGTMYGFIGGDVTERKGAYEHIDVQVPNTQKQFTSDYEYQGTADSKTDFRPRSRDAEDNAEIDGTREALNIAAGYTPNAGGGYESLNPEAVEVDTKKLTQDSMATRTVGNVTRVLQPTAQPVVCCEVTKPAVPLNALKDRLDPNTLSALRSNPYNLNINPL